MASTGGADGEPEFQIAPMIDVLLVLLIFFMSIATTAVTRYDPSINLPTAPDAGKKDDSEGELVFNISWNENNETAVTTFEEVSVRPGDTIPTLMRHHKANPKARVLIRADGETPVAHVNEVIEAAAQAGIVDVIFAAVSK
jgi:biopolymer transport protein ExbD